MARDQGQPTPPPPDLASRSLPLREVGGDWYRIGQARFSPLHYSQDSGWRFSSADQPGVLYVGDRPETCFWEVFWDDLVARKPAERRLDAAKVSARRIWTLTLPRPLRVVDLTVAATLRAIGAHAGTFLGPYELCQRWCAVLRAHPAAPDGLRYASARDSGRTCLALFAERTATLWPPVPPSGRELVAEPALASLISAEGLGLLSP
jgi:hypothetical protein